MDEFERRLSIAHRTNSTEELATLTAIGNREAFDLQSPLLAGDRESEPCPRHPDTRMLQRQLLPSRLRGMGAVDCIAKHKVAYLMAVGGAAYLVAKAIKQARVVGFADLGMEAIYEFDVKDMPVTVAVSADGTSVHTTGPKEWQARIGKIPVAVA